MPGWSVDGALSLMDLVGIRSTMLPVPAPATAPARDLAEAAAVARDVTDFVASLVSVRQTA
jgi:6-methylsalicylate decarboxylase